MVCKHSLIDGSLTIIGHGGEHKAPVWHCSECGKDIPDAYISERKSRYLHMDDDCIRPGGCSGTLQPIEDVVGEPRKGHETWLACDRCMLRYKPIDNIGYVLADTAYYGWSIVYEGGGNDAGMAGTEKT